MVLDKTAVLFDRDDEGEVLPQEVKIIVNEKDPLQAGIKKGDTIIITPMLRGEMKRMFSDLGIKDDKDTTDEEEKDLDAEIMIKHCINPKITKDDAQYLKPYYVTAIVNTILVESGLSPRNDRKKALDEKEDEFAKNSEELNETKKKAI